jgi:hypothetical protein
MAIGDRGAAQSREAYQLSEYCPQFDSHATTPKTLSGSRCCMEPESNVSEENVMTTNSEALTLNDDVTQPPEPPENGLKTTLTTILSFTQGVIPLLIAIIVLWYFATVLKQMFGLTNPAIVGEVQWGRNAYLYAGVEALAYAAAGFLFGREVNRQRAEKAEENASRSQREANSANRVAAQSVANGRALAESVRALEGAQGERRAATKEVDHAPEQAEVRMLRGIADRFFPPPTGTS